MHYYLVVLVVEPGHWLPLARAEREACRWELRSTGFVKGFQVGVLMRLQLVVVGVSIYFDLLLSLWHLELIECW